MLCCAKCIGDKTLLDSEYFRNSELSTCSYCNTAETHIVDFSKARDPFKSLVNIYSISNGDGKTLPEWLQEDWNLFPNMSLAHSRQLLADILNDGEIVRKKFTPPSQEKNSHLDKWFALKEELMHQNRYFPQSRINEERLRELLDQLNIYSYDLPRDWFRSRVQQGKSHYPTSEMGAPPKNISAQGRANPAGIPYLYLASEIETAISETRPHTGQYVTVAIFHINKNLKLVDLRNPRKSVSALALGDEDQIALLRKDLGFLENLGEELTRPVLPQSANIDYVPSQYLCEFIKNCDFDGVIYNSSVGEGINLALFDTNTANAQSVGSYAIDKVQVSISGA